MTRRFALGLFLVSVFVYSCGADSHYGPPLYEDGDRETEAATDGDDSEVSDSDCESDSDSEADTDNAANDCLVYDSCPCDTSADCPEPLVCHPSLGICSEPGDCFADDDCQTDSRDATWICNRETGFCEQRVCRSDDDCPVGQRCEAGVCTITCGEYHIRIVINEGSGIIAEGETRQLTATAYSSTNKVISGFTFNWASDSSEVVSVDYGKLTGGSVFGTARIVASNGGASSEPVTYVNFPKIQSGARVVVADAKGGRLLEETAVYLIPNAAARKSEAAAVLTDANGTAFFPNLDCAAGCALHVRHPEYDVLSAFGVTRNDLFVALEKARDDTVADGVKGHQKADAIPGGLRGDVRLGLTMFSLPANPLDWDQEWPFGEMIRTPIEIGSLKSQADLPSGLEGYLNDTQSLKEGYFASGQPGPNTLWGFGGYALLGDLIDQVSSMIGDTIDYPGILGVILPVFTDFYHGVQTGLTLTARPKVWDRDDLNGNGLTDERVPDLATFATLDLKVTQKQSYPVAIHYPPLAVTTDSGKCTDVAFTVIGVEQKGIGFIPLGLGAGTDKKDKNDESNCRLGAADDGKTTSKYAPQHSGLVGNDYRTISYTFVLDALFDDNPATLFFDHSAALTRSAKAYDDSANPVNVPAFLEYPKAEPPLISETHLGLTVAPQAGASFQRVVWQITDPSQTRTRRWRIYWDGQSAAPDFELPPGLPNYAMNAGQGSFVQAVALENVSYQDLFGFGEVTLGNFGERLTAFSTHYLIR